MFIEKAKDKLLSKFSAKHLEHTILDITKLRTKYLDDLTLSEMEQLYYMFFPSEKPQKQNDQLNQMQIQIELKKQRSIILKDAEYMGIYTAGDWSRFNAFMKYKSVFKKPLNKYTLEEFPALIKQFKSMKSKFSKNKMGDWLKFIEAPSLN